MTTHYFMVYTSIGDIYMGDYCGIKFVLELQISWYNEIR